MLNLPEEYDYLKNGENPRILIEMLNLYGVTEYAGKADNPHILQWAEEIKKYVGIDYKHDSTAWCGLIMGVCAHRAGYTPPNICVRAKEWCKFAKQVYEAKLGDILIFNRKGGGHVGLYVAEDQECFHVLGGNQSDTVKITRIKKNRLYDIRRCHVELSKQKFVRKIFMDRQGDLSHNEL